MQKMTLPKLDPYTNSAYINISNMILQIEGLIPKDLFFIKSLEKKLPNWQNNIIVKNTEHIVKNTYFQMIYSKLDFNYELINYLFSLLENNVENLKKSIF